MQVIILNDFAYVNGGASKVALDSALGLVGKVDKVVLFSAVEPVMHELYQKGVQLVCTGQKEIAKDPNRLRAMYQGIWNHKAAVEIEKLLKDFDSSDTIIHLHGWTKALSSSPVRTALKMGFKVVCTLHDYFTACPNGAFFNYTTNSSCKLRPLSLKCISTQCDVRSYPQKLYRVIRQLTQKEMGLIPKGIRHFITVSKFSESILAPYLPKNTPFYSVDNPISIKKEKPVVVANNQAFVMLGRVSKEKGPHLFAKAIQSLNAHGIVVGDGPYMETLQNIAPNLDYRGWQTTEAVKESLQNIKALVLPSLWYETQGLVVSEAAALGVPAIVPDTSAARDLVVNGETGLWFKGGDVEDLQNKMKLLLDDSQFVAELGKAAYQSFWNNPPTLSRHVEQLLSVYEKVLKR
ncbi:hypothetical protein PN36_02705 [Candidatus Thiomargarita nelsonii]|uniref:Glycosyl transferase family 1 domain-containing protein n=1 Tax=Candidatus Thiomargarita nelsonii TaxID=1003181 RepID=A0A0A6PCU0_9GAMM|nr:hypothetical protein PN36_02705 [Candidatus Thiomargarita nelsonii]